MRAASHEHLDFIGGTVQGIPAPRFLVDRMNTGGREEVTVCTPESSHGVPSETSRKSAWSSPDAKKRRKAHFRIRVWTCKENTKGVNEACRCGRFYASIERRDVGSKAPAAGTTRRTYAVGIHVRPAHQIVNARIASQMKYLATL